MKIIYYPKEERDIYVPDCYACGDDGAIMVPTLVWRGREFPGHGPRCSCWNCRTWPKAPRDYFERLAERDPAFSIPIEAIRALESGKAQTYRSLANCPFCEEGRRYARWVSRDPEFQNDKGKMIRFRRRPARRLSYSDPYGKEILEIHFAMIGDRKGITQEEMEIAATGIAKRIPSG